MKIKTTAYRLTELFLLFIMLPIVMVINFPIWIKLIIGLLGFKYVIYVLLKVEKVKFKISSQLYWKAFWRSTLLKFLIIVSLTTLYVWLTDKGQLFVVIRTKPLFWFVILMVYSFLSVYPQELLYRTFYFKRYGSLIKNQNLFIFINAVIFSLGHLFFRNSLVIILTFSGGLLFAFTYAKTKSTLLVSIEHALYGCWLFTVGMGTMLGFPS